MPLVTVGKDPITTELHPSKIIFPGSKIYLISIPNNWHSGWKKLENPTIRLVLDTHCDRREFVNTAPSIDKDTLFKNKFNTYRIPHVYGIPYLLNSTNFYTIINHSSEISQSIEVVLPISYSEAADCFRVISQSTNKY